MLEAAPSRRSPHAIFVEPIQAHAEKGVLARFVCNGDYVVFHDVVVEGLAMKDVPKLSLSTLARLRLVLESTYLQDTCPACVHVYIMHIDMRRCKSASILNIHTNVCTYSGTWVRTYIHTCIHTYIHTYIHACIHTYIHTYMPVYVCRYIYIHVCVRTS